MQTQITVRHTDATTYHRVYAQEQLEKLSKVYSQIHDAHVVLSEEGLDKKAEMRLGVKGPDLFATETAPTHEAAIDKCIARLRRALVKHKDTVKSTDPERFIYR